MANIHRMSTSAVPPPERLAYWNDVCMGAYGATVVDAEPVGFHGVLTRLTAGDLQITSVRSAPAVSRNTAGRDKGGGDETAFSLQLVHSGRCRIRHAGIESRASSGDMILADRSRSYELSFTEPVQGLVLSPPWARFGGHAEAFEAMAGRLMDVSSGPAAVLSSFIRSAWDELAEGGEEDWPPSATEVIWDLLAAALRGQTDRETFGRRAGSLRREARALIDGRLSDPGFRSAGIAPGLGVSARYLQMAFAEAGTTPSRFLLERRLDAAAVRLRGSDRAVRVTDVALECGFNDLSYFSRAFRRRFGVSARTYGASSGGRITDRT